MSAAIPNLWPPLSFLGENPPIITLREQASYLASRTNALVVAEVATNAAGEEFVHSFDFVAPALDNYRYRLFFARHKIERGYPVSILFLDNKYSAKDRNELLERLKFIFSHDRTQTVLQSLWAHSQSPT